VSQYPKQSSERTQQSQSQSQPLPLQTINDDESEVSHLYQYKRNDNMELTQQLQTIITKLNEIIRFNFNGFPSIFNLTHESQPNHPFLNPKLYPFETLKCAVSELAIVSLLRSIVKELNELTTQLITKIVGTSTKIKEHKASRRIRDSFYKFLGSLDNIFLILTLIFHFVEAEFCKDNRLISTAHNNIQSNENNTNLIISSKTKNKHQKRIKVLNRMLSFLQRSKMKLMDNMWALILEEFIEFLPLIQKNINEDIIVILNK
jgi:hypothetical protein